EFVSRRAFPSSVGPLRVYSTTRYRGVASSNATTEVQGELGSHRVVPPTESSYLAERSVPPWVPSGITQRPAAAVLLLRTRPPRGRWTWVLPGWSFRRRVRVSQGVPSLRGSPRGIPPRRSCGIAPAPAAAGRAALPAARGDCWDPGT